MEARAQQAGSEVLLESSESVAGTIRHVVDRRQIERLPRSEGERSLGAGLVGIKGDLLLEGHALLLRDRDDAALGAVGVRLPDLVSIHHHREALLHIETGEMLSGGVRRRVGHAPDCSGTVATQARSSTSTGICRSVFAW